MNADCAGDINDRKSTYGFVFILVCAVINWGSKKQGCVALSIMEAKYIAIAHAPKEVI
jgi:hypothetical protein